MFKPKLKIGFADTHNHLASFFYYLLSSRYSLELDNTTPEVLIFGDRNFGEENLKFSRKECVKLFYTGENQRPQDYDCDYAISFDHISEPWHYRLPLFVIYMWALEHLHRTPFKYDHLFHLPAPAEKTDFCSFVVSNPGCPQRNEFFSLLNSYKKVDSAGKLFKNIDIDLPDENSKIDFLSKRKFNICFEAYQHPGYVTEKILHAFYARTVPIYWGSQTIDVDFNPRAFINANNYRSLGELADAVIAIDNDDNLYAAIANQPKFLYNIPTSYVILDNFLNWFDAVVNGKIEGRLNES